MGKRDEQTKASPKDSAKNKGPGFWSKLQEDIKAGSDDKKQRFAKRGNYEKREQGDRPPRKQYFKQKPLPGGEEGGSGGENPTVDKEGVVKRFQGANNRYGQKHNQNRFPRRIESSFGNGEEEEISGFKKKRHEDDLEDGIEGDDNADSEFGRMTEQDDPLLNHLLLDHEEFAKLAASGHEGIDVSDMDALDALAATAFFESFKTPSGNYETFIANPKARRLRKPQPRSLVQLMAALQPRIDVPRDSTGYALGQTAWQVIQRSFYYNDQEKYRLVNGIAKTENRFAEFDKTHDADDIDDVMLPSFRPGRAYMELELSGELDRKVVKKEKASKGVTNWAVEAVVDEDQL